MKKVDIKYLKSLFTINPDTGILIWKERPMSHFKTKKAFKSWNTKYKNKVAGHLNGIGYIDIGIDGKLYKAHRLAFALYNGYFSEFEIDHIDRIRNNNCKKNLREASHQCNMRNSTMYSNNKTGVTGVCFHSRDKVFFSRITVAPDNIKHIGNFKNMDDAVMARWEAEKKYNFPNCCTSSTAYEYLKKKNLI